MSDFVNILEKFDSQLWMFRLSNFVKAFSSMDAKPSAPDDIKTKVFESELYKAIEELARDCDPSDRNFIHEQSKALLKEIGYARSLRTIRWLALLITKILNKLMSGIYVNESALLKLKESMGNCPLVFVPTHRSYGDFILMAFICFMYQIEIPCVAAGLDFLSMWLLGEVIRNTKAFYIRRSFRSDKLYKLLFEQYVAKLLTHGDSPLEFFIEGTRSRTGKSLKPKYGFLSMILKPFLSGEIPDVKFVPVAISYDRVLEEWLFIRELQGVPKPKESTSGLFKAKSILKENYGNAYFHFGEPISIHEWIRRQSDVAVPRPGANDVKTLASLIIKTHIKLQVVSVTHLVMICIYSNLIVNNRTYISLKSVIDGIPFILNILKDVGVCILELQDNIEEGIRAVSTVNSSLIKIQNGTLSLNGTAQVENSESTAGVARCEGVKHEQMIALLLYVNPVAAVLFSPSLLLLIILTGDQTNMDKKFQYLSYLFEYEFPAACYEWEQSYETSKEFLLHNNCVYQCDEAKNQFALSTNLPSVNLLYSLIFPYILGYLLIAQRLLQISDASTSQQLEHECKVSLGNFLNQTGQMFPMFLTNPFVSYCISSLIKVGPIYQIAKNAGKEMYCVNVDKMSALISLLSPLNITLEELRLMSKL